jgi:hypothetical protein
MKTKELGRCCLPMGQAGWTTHRLGTWLLFTQAVFPMLMVLLVNLDKTEQAFSKSQAKKTSRTHD